jgi:hypothetical protein
MFVGLDEERSLQKKCGYTTRITRSHFGCCCPHKETKIMADEEHASFLYEFQSALRLTVGFSNFYCEM